MNSPPATPQPRLADGYRMVGRIRRGPDATLYRAVRENDERDVVLKVLHTESSDIEAARLRQLPHHPHLVPVLGSGHTDDGLPYLAMPYHPDGSYEDHITRYGPIPLDDAIQVGLTIADALHAVHTAGLVHGDVTPANILRSDDGPLLADFEGAAAPVELSTTVTLARLTPAHAAPEVLTRQPTDARSDVYGLASTVWTLLAGHPPFASAGSRTVDPFEYHENVLNVPVPPVPRGDVPLWLQAVLMRSMAKSPVDRYPDVAAFGTALRDQADPVPHPRREPPPSAPAPPPPVPTTPAPATPEPTADPEPDTLPLPPVPVRRSLRAEAGTLSDALPLPPAPDPATLNLPPPVLVPTPAPAADASDQTPRDPPPGSPAAPDPLAEAPALGRASTRGMPAASGVTFAPPPTSGPLPPRFDDPHVAQGELRLRLPRVVSWVDVRPQGSIESARSLPPAPPPPEPNGELWQPGLAQADWWPEEQPRAPRWRTRLAVVGAIACTVTLGAALVAAIASNLSHQPDSPESQPDQQAAPPEPTLADPAAPTDLELSDGQVEVTLSWEDPTSGEAAFTVIGYPFDGDPTVFGWAEPGETSLRINGLNPQLDYCFWVVAGTSVDVEEVPQSEERCTERE